jgi:hypothetical protein
MEIEDKILKSLLRHYHSHILYLIAIAFMNKSNALGSKGS